MLMQAEKKNDEFFSMLPSARTLEAQEKAQRTAGKPGYHTRTTGTGGTELHQTVTGTCSKTAHMIPYVKNTTLQKPAERAIDSLSKTCATYGIDDSVSKSGTRSELLNARLIVISRYGCRKAPAP
jgi:hypothetical protein